MNARRAYDEHFHRRPLFEAARITGWMSIQPYMQKGCAKGPADVFPLAWDQKIETKPEAEVKPISLAEAEAMFARFNQPSP